MIDIENIELTYLSMDDYQELKEAMISAYTSMPNAYWREHHIQKLIDLFPEGQVVVKVNGQIAGCALSIIVNYDDFDKKVINLYRSIKKPLAQSNCTISL